MTNQRNFKWNTLYNEKPVEEMGWYYPELDPYLETALSTRNITTGTFLDLGTGPRRQAIELAKKGFSVTGTDISSNAIEGATQLSGKAHLKQDDILNSTLNTQFDYIFDRGCYHVFGESNRPAYVRAVKQLLKDNGLLFLKCFSDREPDIGKGPYRSSENTINKTFGKEFNIETITHTVYQGTRETFPKALFAIMRKNYTLR